MNKKILRLAIPNILSNLTVPLLSSVDTAIMGHIEGVYYLGAIAIGSMIFNFLYWGFGFLRMGTTGLTAQAFGAKDKTEVILFLLRSCGIGILFSLLIIGFQIPIAEFSFGIVNASHDVETFGREYFDIRVYAAPATLLLYAIQGWFLGVQNARYPLVIAIVVNVSNLIFNLVFIYLLGMKSDGVALGTVLAQYLGLITGVLLFFKKYKHYLSFINYQKLIDKSKLKNFFKVNTDIFIRTLCLIFAFSYFTAKSAEYNDNILAANTILLQLWLILSYGVDGFAFAAESLVGKYFGAKDYSNIRKVIKYAFSWAMVFAIVLSLVYLVGQDLIIKIFTNNEEVILIALQFFTWTIIAPIINSACFIWDGVFIGATKTKAMRNTMIVSTFIFYLPVYLLTKEYIGNHALWLAMISFMFIRGLSLSWYARKYFYNFKFNDGQTA